MLRFQGYKTVINALLDQPRHLLALRLTLLLVLLYGSSNTRLDVPVRILCGWMLLAPRLTMAPGLWIGLCGAMWWVNATDWLWIDNHQFLISYWCLVCGLAVSSKHPDAVLAWNGRFLIGLVFFFATLWKLLSGEYLDGSFLHYTFLSDDRVQLFATAMGGLDPAVLPQNQLLESALKLAPHLSLAVTLGTSPALERFALAASYWTLLIEGTVAIAFLCFVSRRFAPWRNRLLLIFVATTYFLLPVLGFAYVLIIMGLAQSPTEQKGDRLAYLLLLAALQFARFPWQSWL